MLIKYTFRNFRSFHSETVLDMQPFPKQRSLSEILIERQGQTLLPSAVIYGANASGKSNIVLSLSVMREIVLKGSLRKLTAPFNSFLEFYTFAYVKDSEPMLFKIEFINQDVHFVYSFEVMAVWDKFNKREIISEDLWIVRKKEETVIFNRSYDKVTFSKSSEVLSILQYKEKLLLEIENRINKNLDDNELILPGVFKTVVNNELAEKVLDFFRSKIYVVNDFTLNLPMFKLKKEESHNKDYDILYETMNAFAKSADFGPQKIAFETKKTDDGSLADLELFSVYKFGEKTILIPAEMMESRGTLKLLDFAGVFPEIFLAGGLFVIDEFDAAIHPEIIKGIVALFNNRDTNINGAQLIFTTHNPIYLNNKMFRRDQIKFVEKDRETYESEIFSLADFGATSVRSSESYLMNYLKGKYTTLPFIDFSLLLDNYQSEVNNEKT